MLTRLVNVKREKCQFLIDRTTMFGNPYKIGSDGTREEVLEKYKKYFDKRILTDKFFRDKVNSLKGKVIGCWCVPDLCHGMIIIEYLEGIPYLKKNHPKIPLSFFD